MAEKTKNIVLKIILLIVANAIVLAAVMYIPRNTEAQSCMAYGWPPGSYCILRAGGSCPAGFSGNGNGQSPTQPGWWCMDTQDGNDTSVPQGASAFLGDSGRGGCGGSEHLNLCCK